MPNSETRYTATAATLHWIVAALVLFMIALGWSMQAIPKVPVGPRVDAFNLHKSIGVTILALMVVRIAWRATHPAPSLPPMPRWQSRLAHTVHLLLYICLLVQPLTGYLGSVFSGYPVRIYGFVLPSWAAKNEALKDAMSVAHLVNSIVLVTAIGLHLAGALRHALIERDGLLRRMWPWGSRTRDPMAGVSTPG